MPSKATDDERPSGLKFTRNNFFGFPKRTSNDTSPISTRAPPNNPRTTPPTLPLLPSTRRDYDERDSFDSHHSSVTSPYEPSFTLPRIAQQPAVAAAAPTVATPTVPTRSPFRIRDSQLSAATQSRIISSHDLYAKPSTHEDVSYSPITSPSSTNSSAAEDDLSHELENMWKLKAPHEPLKEASLPKINSDDMLTQLLISQAIIDTKDYKLLSFDEVESLKEHHNRLLSQISHSSHKYELEKKIQETSHSLSNLTPNTILNNQRQSVLILRDEAVEADRKVSDLAKRLNDLKKEEIESQYKILQHTAAALSHGLQQLEKSQQINKSGPFTSSEINERTSFGVNNKQQEEQLNRLRSQLETITDSLNTLLIRYDVADIKDKPPTVLLDILEKKLSQHKSDTRKLETKLETIEEKYQLESIAENKMAIQLKAAQEKKAMTESRYKHLQKEFDDYKEKNGQSDWMNGKIDMEFKDDQHIKLDEIENELVEAKEKQYTAERELELGHEEIDKLKSMVTDMEIKESKVQSQLALFENREAALKKELEQYKDEVFQARTEKEKWDKVMKRQTVIQLMDGTNSSSLTDKYEQQLEEQEQEYQAQLKEQAALLNKTMQQCDTLQIEHDKLVATCSDLELLIRDKTRVLDARDNQITQLEDERRKLAMSTNSRSDNGDTLKQIQAAFSAKEDAWIEQSTAMESNFEGILKEFDRLTGTAMEFESDKMNYEKRIDELSAEIKRLETSLTEEKAKNLGYQNDTPTTASLRREFRKMISDMKADHQRTLEKEAEEKKRLERQLKDMKHDRDMSSYERINKGVQTLFIA